MGLNYPAWRYHATEAPKRIFSEAEESAGWHDSPAKCVADPAADTAIGTGPVAPVATDPAPAVATDGTGVDPRAAELHAAKADDVIANIKEITDPALLATVLTFENLNPKGARKGVIAAIGARAKALEKAATAAPTA